MHLCSLCLSPGIGQCPETHKIFCSEKCQFVDWYLIGGRNGKRVREEEGERERTMDPLLRQVLTAVSRSGRAIVDVLLEQFDINDVISWSLVSYEFNQIVAKNQYFWYLFLRRFSRNFDEPFSPPGVNPNTGEEIGVNYYERAKDEFYNQFKKLFQVVIISESGNFGVQFGNRELYEEYEDRWVSKQFSVFDIMNYGGLRRLVELLDDFDLCSLDGNDMSEDTFIYTGSVNGEYQDTSSDMLSIHNILRSYNRNFTEIIEQMQDESIPITVTLLIDREEPNTFRVDVTYPRELIQPFTKDMKQFQDEAFETTINKPPMETLTYEFTYWENEDVNFFYEKLYELPIPPFFTLRGDYARPLDPTEWEVIVDGKYYLPETYLDMERIVQILEENDPYWKSTGSFDIEIKKK